MSTAKCRRCGGVAIGGSFEEASAKINHAVGLTRSIPCGANYNCVIEIDKSVKTIPEKKIQEPILQKKKVTKTKTEKILETIPETIPQTISESIKE